MRKIFTSAWMIGLFGIASVAFAQVAPPDGATEAQMDAAFKDLSAVYGSPVVRVDQAKAICNEEKYVVDCAEIGKKHDLFSDTRSKQVDTLLTEFKGEVLEKMKRCDDAACLVDVAASIASRLNSENPSVARAVELTPQKVKEKKTIVDTAKSLGVDMEECRTMDPDTASVELLRGCARLAKHENVQKYIPQATKDRAEGADAAIALKESLASGRISCGDNTLEGCGNFCLAPSPEARAKGTSAIPEVCRQIASQFFGGNGVKELERAYAQVQETFGTLTDRAQNIVFTTADGRTLSDHGSIGRYMEEAGSQGDVEAVSSGMDFLVKKGFVTEKDRDFAISMIKKVKERGPVNFGECRTDPSKCADLISEEDRGQFTTMGEIDKIMRTEMRKRGVSDPSVCSSDRSAGQSCLEAALAALPQIELLAKDSPQAQNIVSDIRQKIRFGEAGMEARSRVEERFKASGDFSIGERRFSSIAELEAFCRTNSQQCLSETAREGIFSRDVAEERYERSMEIRYNAVSPENIRGTPFSPGDFNKEEALQQFKQWLDNPTGPPPMPPSMDPRQYQQYPQYPAPYSPYQRPPIDQSRCQYAQVMPVPCKAGEYRQESVNEFGCQAFGSCIPLTTRTEPPRPDGRNICPALPTVESCPAGEGKTIAFSSPECGTYYSCRATYKPPVDDQNQITAGCERYGSGWRSMDSSGNCFSPSATEYRTISGMLNSCASAPVYGCSSSDVPPSTVPPYPVSTGQREQVWNSSGLRSWVRADADQTRIESLKQACASVPSGANIWLPNAGAQSSSDFGMPDSSKCARATSCLSGQYFDGSICTTGNQQPSSCGSGQYWNGTACVSSGGTSSMYRCTYPNAYFNTDYREFTAFCERDYVNCKRVDTNASIGTTGLTLGAPSSCESGLTNSSTSCPSGQYWNGSACVTSTTQTNTVTGSCSSELIGLLGSGCHTMGGGWFNSEMTRYMVTGSNTVKSCATEYMSGCSGGTTQTQTSCSSGQYWNGTACVTSTTQTSPSTSCPSGQWWNGSSCTSATTGTDYASAQQGCASAGGTWDSAANYCRMPGTTTSCASGQYWNGSACVATSPTNTVPTDTTSAQQGCVSAGGTWDSSANYCRMPSSSNSCPSGQYWNGSACQSSGSTYTAPAYTPPPTTGSYTPPPPTENYTPPPTTTTGSAPTAYIFCPGGHDWNGAYCTLSPRSPLERYTANVWSAVHSLLGL